MKNLTSSLCINLLKNTTCFIVVVIKLITICVTAQPFQVQDGLVFNNNDLEDRIYIQEDRDYPLNKAETYRGVDNVAGITVLPSNDVVIFHRADRDLITGDEYIFRNNFIKNDTIMILSGTDGSELVSFGSNLFKMPHGIASDSKGNLWVTDIYLNKVMRLPTSQAIKDKNWTMLRENLIKPDIILRGDRVSEFSGPSEVKIQLEGSNGNSIVYVADGYANNRILAFDESGTHLKTFGQFDIPTNGLVHSLSLIEKRNMVCAADRENKFIYCFNAGLDGDLGSMGDFIFKYNYTYGAVYSIVALGPNNLLVSSRRDNTDKLPGSVGKFDIAIVNLVSMNGPNVTPTWLSEDLAYPHSMAKSMDGSHVYVADLRQGVPKKVYQFKIIKGKYPRLE